MNLFIILVALTVILAPSFALISSSQTNDTSSGDTQSNQTFSSMSREFANESESDSDDESDQEPED